MISEFQIRVLPRIAANDEEIKKYIADDKGIALRSITAIRIIKRSIDARQRSIFVNFLVRVYINE